MDFQQVSEALQEYLQEFRGSSVSLGFRRSFIDFGGISESLIVFSVGFGGVTGTFSETSKGRRGV